MAEVRLRVVGKAPQAASGSRAAGGCARSVTLSPLPTPHCRLPSASRCLSSSSRPFACSACSSQAAVCLRPGAAHWSRSRPSSTPAGCPSGPSQGLAYEGPNHPGQAYALCTDTPATGSSGPGVSQSTLPPGQAVHLLWAGGPQQAACCAAVPQLRPWGGGGAGSAAPDGAKAVTKNKAARTSALVPHSYKEHFFPCRSMLGTEYRDGGGKVALY